MPSSAMPDGWSGLIEKRRLALEFLEIDHDIRVLEDGRVWIAGGVTPATSGTTLDLSGLIDAINRAVMPPDPLPKMRVPRETDDEVRARIENRRAIRKALAGEAGIIFCTADRERELIIAAMDRLASRHPT